MNIRRRREELGISRNELSKKVGVSATAIYKWENKQALPRGRRLQQLSSILNCSIDELFDDGEIS